MSAQRLKTLLKNSLHRPDVTSAYGAARSRALSKQNRRTLPFSFSLCRADVISGQCSAAKTFAGGSLLILLDHHFGSLHNRRDRIALFEIEFFGASACY